MSQPTNPFDDDNGRFYVLRNKEEQHSLWPTFAAVTKEFPASIRPAWKAAAPDDAVAPRSHRHSEAPAAHPGGYPVPSRGF